MKRGRKTPEERRANARERKRRQLAREAEGTVVRSVAVSEVELQAWLGAQGLLPSHKANDSDAQTKGLEEALARLIRAHVHA
jgi:hypothetical protein